MKRFLTILSLTGLMILGFPALISPREPDHWALEARSPAVITIYDATEDVGWGLALLLAAAEWNRGIEGVEFQFAEAIGPKGSCKEGAGPYTVVVCIHEVKPGYLGIAYRHHGNGHIQSVRIWLTPTPNLSVACHELGHALGLGHRGRGALGSCMTQRPNASYPDERDFQRVTEIHRHLH